MAIFILLLLAGLGVLTMKYVKIKAHHYADSFIKEQAELFADSVVEATLLKIEGVDRVTEGCKTSFGFVSPDKRFEANVSVLRYYLYKGLDNDRKSYCFNVVAVQTRESHGYVLLELNVTTRSGARVQNPVRIHRRTLQRP